MAAARSLDVLVGAGNNRRAALPAAAAIGTHILTTTYISQGEVHGSTPTSSRLALATTTAITTATARPASTLRSAAPAASGRGAAFASALRGEAPASGVVGALFAAAFAGLFARSVGQAQLVAAGEPSAANLRKAVGAGIHGLVPLQAAWCARGGKPLVGAGLMAALPLAKALARKVSPT
jgi:4-hydroxybenzoate polyprenyltransferase